MPCYILEGWFVCTGLGWKGLYKLSQGHLVQGTAYLEQMVIELQDIWGPTFLKEVSKNASTNNYFAGELIFC